MAQEPLPVPGLPEVSDRDILQAMREIPGYLDITPADFKELYLRAYRQALSRLTSSRRAEEIMTTEVAWVSPGTPLPDVARIMADRHVSGLPVLDSEQRVAGVISNQDFLRLMGGERAASLMGLVAHCLGAEGCLVGELRRHAARDVMSAPAVTVGSEATLAHMAQIMSQRRVNRLPVVDPQGRLLGIVSRADLLRASAGA